MRVKCAGIQLQFKRDTEANIRSAVEAIEEAARADAQIICLPELATNIYFPYELDSKHLALAETVPGPSTDAIAAAAKRAGVHVIFPLYEHVQDGELYNSAVLIGPEGNIIGKYRKNSIAFVHREDALAMEKFYFRPGNLGYPVFPTELGIDVGIIICYDRHFPEGPRSLALAGADVMFVPSTTPAGGDMWDVELRAHAMANLMWVIAVNRVDFDEDASPWRYYGRSLAIAPDGNVVAAAGEEGPETIYAEIDTELSRELRDGWGFLRDRRPDAYGAVVAP